MTEKQKKLCELFSGKVDGISRCIECPMVIDAKNRECIATLEAQKESVVPNVSIFDKVERITNCTVEILTNTQTGETSVGWWRND